MSFIIRDDADGDAVGAGAGRLQSLLADVEACCAALQTAQAWGMTRITLETDAQELVAAISSSNAVWRD